MKIVSEMKEHLLQPLHRGVECRSVAEAFMSGRLLGFDPTYAMGFQAAFGSITLICCFVCSRKFRDPITAFTLFSVASIVISPQAFNYDMILTSVGMVLLIKHRALDMSSKFVCFSIGAVWGLPLWNILLAQIGVPIGPVLLLALLASLVCTVRVWSIHLIMPQRG